MSIKNIICRRNLYVGPRTCQPPSYLVVSVCCNEDFDHISSKKHFENKLEVPGFTITPANSELQPGSSIKLDIQCYPDSLKEYKEVVYLHVSEPLKEFVGGKMLTLHVTSCEPLLNFNFPKEVFNEQFFVQSIDLFNAPISVCLFTGLSFIKLSFIYKFRLMVTVFIQQVKIPCIS